MYDASHESPQQRHRQAVAGFNIYRTPGVRESVPDVQVAAWYQGMLVDGPARVIETLNDSVVFAIGPEQSRALEHARHAFVESPVHGTSFRSRVASHDSDQSTVTLSQFEPFKDFMERRNWPRVTPSHGMLIRLMSGELELPGQVVDLSVNSLAAVFELSALETLMQLEEVELDIWGDQHTAIPLPDFHVCGRMLQVKGLREGTPPATHVVITLQSYPALLRVLDVYVARREREIMCSLSKRQR